MLCLESGKLRLERCIRGCKRGVVNYNCVDRVLQCFKHRKGRFGIFSVHLRSQLSNVHLRVPSSICFFLFIMVTTSGVICCFIIFQIRVIIFICAVVYRLILIPRERLESEFSRSFSLVNRTPSTYVHFGNTSRVPDSATLCSRR